MIDVMDFISALEDKRTPPPLLSREDMVILALVDNTRCRGFCAACGVAVPAVTNCRWCAECNTIALRFLSLKRAQNPHGAGKKRCTCGRLVTKGNSAYRCDKCQKEAHLAARRERWRKRQGRAAT